MKNENKIMFYGQSIKTLRLIRNIKMYDFDILYTIHSKTTTIIKIL